MLQPDEWDGFRHCLMRRPVGLPDSRRRPTTLPCPPLSSQVKGRVLTDPCAGLHVGSGIQEDPSQLRVAALGRPNAARSSRPPGPRSRRRRPGGGPARPPRPHAGPHRRRGSRRMVRPPRASTRPIANQVRPPDPGDAQGRATGRRSRGPQGVLECPLSPWGEPEPHGAANEKAPVESPKDSRSSWPSS